MEVISAALLAVSKLRSIAASSLRKLSFSASLFSIVSIGMFLVFSRIEEYGRFDLMYGLTVSYHYLHSNSDVIS